MAWIFGGRWNWMCPPGRDAEGRARAVDAMMVSCPGVGGDHYLVVHAKIPLRACLGLRFQHYREDAFSLRVFREGTVARVDFWKATICSHMLYSRRRVRDVVGSLWLEELDETGNFVDRIALT